MSNTMHGCNEILDFISLSLDHELDDVRRGRLRRHLAACPDCARAYQELRAVDTLFQQAPMRLAPGDFTERVVQLTIDDAVRRNVITGVVILFVGTLIISSILLMGYLELFWLVASVVLAHGFISSGPLWLAEMAQALALAGRVALVMIDILRAMLLGPLLVPSLLALLSAAALPIALRQEWRRASHPLRF